MTGHLGDFVCTANAAKSAFFPRRSKTIPVHLESWTKYNDMLKGKSTFFEHGLMYMRAVSEQRRVETTAWHVSAFTPAPCRILNAS